MSSTVTTSGGSGTGSQDLNFSFGSNTSGSTKTYTLTLKSSDNTINGGTLTVSQVAADKAVTGVSVSPSSLTMNVGQVLTIGRSNNDDIKATVSPSDATNKNLTWTSDDSSKVSVDNAEGKITGVAETSLDVAVWATSDADSSKKDSCLITVVQPGSIVITSKNQLKNDTGSDMPITLERIDTTRPLNVSLTSGTTWATYNSYDSSLNVLKFSLQANNTGDPRSTTVTVKGYDLAGVQRTATATLSQNGVDSIQLIGLSVTGDSVISDHGETGHRYILAYNPSDTSEKGVTWDVIDASTSQSVVGTKVSLSGNTGYCTVTALSGASNENLIVTATSTVRPAITASCSVNVTYVPVVPDLQVNPSSMQGSNIIPWDSTTDSTPVVTWSNVNTPYIPQNGGFDGFITGASLNTTTGVITTTFSQNSSTSSPRTGSVTVKALGNDPTPISVTVVYTQGIKPDPSVNTSVGVDTLTVSGGSHPAMTANVRFDNRNNYDHTFPGEFHWVLYGYEDSSYTNETELRSGTVNGYTSTVGPHSTGTYNLSESWVGTLGMSVYFKLTITIYGYNVIPAEAAISNGPAIIE